MSNKKPGKIGLILAICLVVVLLIDALVYVGCNAFAEKYFLRQVSKDAEILYHLNAGNLDSKTIHGILYITKKDDVVTIGYADPIKTNYLLTNLMGDSVWYKVKMAELHYNTRIGEITSGKDMLDPDWLADKNNMYIVTTMRYDSTGKPHTEVITAGFAKEKFTAGFTKGEPQGGTNLFWTEITGEDQPMMGVYVNVTQPKDNVGV